MSQEGSRKFVPTLRRLVGFFRNGILCNKKRKLYPNKKGKRNELNNASSRAEVQQGTRLSRLFALVTRHTLAYSWRHELFGSHRARGWMLTQPYSQLVRQSITYAGISHSQWRSWQLFSIIYPASVFSHSLSSLLLLVFISCVLLFFTFVVFWRHCPYKFLLSFLLWSFLWLLFVLLCFNIINIVAFIFVLISFYCYFSPFALSLCIRFVCWNVFVNSTKQISWLSFACCLRACVYATFSHYFINFVNTYIFIPFILVHFALF